MTPDDAPLELEAGATAAPASGLVRVAHLTVGTVLTSRASTRLHLLLDRLTGGRFPGPVLGFRTIVLTTTGRRTGRRIDAPLTAIEDGGGWVVAASNGGRERPPAWLLNLRAEPRAEVRVAGRRVSVLASETDDGERVRLWARIVAAYGGYDTYRRRTSREIPLVRLDPVTPA